MFMQRMSSSQEDMSTRTKFLRCFIFHVIKIWVMMWSIHLTLEFFNYSKVRFFKNLVQSYLILILSLEK
jgi:hypothetical protein